MYRGSSPRILPIVIIVLVVALVIAALVSVGRMVFSSNTSSTNQSENDGVAAVLLDTADTRAVRWAVRGPIVGDERFQSYQIMISPTARMYTVYNGYLDQVISTNTYDNNIEAYTQFVYALSLANIATTRSAADSDLRGVCATNGLAYVFETVKSDVADHSIWSSSCAGSKGTMAAQPDQIQALFVNQVPDFKPLFNQIY
jgi:flagellar basal body-associated protein FliL